MAFSTTRIVAAVAFCLLATGVPAAWAWNDTGHETVASIAFDELTPAARQRVIAILRQHPRFEKDLLAGKPDGFDADRYAFMVAATWPDLVRAQAHPMHFVANHPEWHYINVDWAAPGFAIANQPPATAPAGPKNIVEALTKAVADLGDPQLPDADKAIALCWVLHLGGDIHQPLHASNFFSPQFPQGDHGGNGLIVLRYAGQVHSQITLHWLWDTMLGTQRSPVLIGYLADGLRHDPQFSPGAMARDIEVRDVERWVAESHDLAVDVAYLHGELHGANALVLSGDSSTPIPPVPPGYLEQGEKVAMKRVALAGHRVAALLNDRSGH